MIENDREWRSTLTGESLLLGLLARSLYQNPEKSWLQPLLDDGLFAEAPFAGGQPRVVEGLALLSNWSRRFGDGLSEEGLQELQVDYTRLFTGMTRLPVAPWESVYFTEERLVFQEQTLDVRAWYRRFGLEVERPKQEPDDHIALELSFLAHLAGLGLEAIAEHDQERFQELQEAQRGFLAKHPLVWGPLWAQQMLSYARTDFYQGMALLVWGALDELAAIYELPAGETAGA